MAWQPWPLAVTGNLPVIIYDPGHARYGTGTYMRRYTLDIRDVGRLHGTDQHPNAVIARLTARTGIAIYMVKYHPNRFRLILEDLNLRAATFLF